MTKEKIKDIIKDIFVGLLIAGTSFAFVTLIPLDLKPVTANTSQETTTQPEHGTFYSFDKEKTVADLKDGEKARSVVLFTEPGEAYVCPNHELLSGVFSYDYPQVWHKGQHWYAQFPSKPHDSSHTGYSSIPDGCFPVTLE